MCMHVHTHMVLTPRACICVLHVYMYKMAYILNYIIYIYYIHLCGSRDVCTEGNS